MTDNQSTGGGTSGTTQVQPARQPFPIERLLYSIGFAIVAWFVFWVAVLLAVLQFVATAASGRVNEELKGISQSVIQYLEQLVSYISLVKDDRPFPLGPFPKH
jgi:hypothetical protein